MPARWFALLGLLAASPSLAPAQAPTPATATLNEDGSGPVVLDCRAIGTGRCSFFAPAGAEVRAFSIVDLADGAPVEGEFVNFARAPGTTVPHREATLVLVDATSGLGGGRVPTATATRALAQTLARTLDRMGEVAVGTFGPRFDLLAGPDVPAGERADAVVAINFDEVSTQLYASLGEAVDWLAARPADVRRLVVLSDGLPEDDRRQHEARVVAAAREAGVAISALALYWHATGHELNTRGADVLGALARQTNGVFADADARGDDISADPLLAALERQRENSGYVVPSERPGALQVGVRAGLPRVGVAGELADRRFVAELEDPTPPPAPPDPDPDPSPPWLWIAVAAAVLALIGVALFFYLRWRQPEVAVSAATGGEFAVPEGEASPGLAEDGGATRASGGAPTPDDRPVLALLQRTDGGAPAFEVRGTRVSIGRGTDNDLILSHDSVSRVHCEIHQGRDGGFTVTDLGSLNGVRVNGRQQHATRLNSGDVLRLGDVELSFEYADAADRVA